MFKHFHMCVIYYLRTMSRDQSKNFRNKRTRNQNWTNDKNIATVECLYMIGTVPNPI